MNEMYIQVIQSTHLQSMRWSIFFKDKITNRKKTNETQNFLIHVCLPENE